MDWCGKMVLNIQMQRELMPLRIAVGTLLMFLMLGVGASAAKAKIGIPEDDFSTFNCDLNSATIAAKKELNAQYKTAFDVNNTQFEEEK